MAEQRLEEPQGELDGANARIKELEKELRSLRKEAP